jgi:hypothetical protein
MVLLNLVLVGFAMFQLAHFLTHSFVASILAGIVFAFNTNSLYETVHPVLLSVWCFPWATLYFLRAVCEKRIRWAVITAVFIFLGAATSTLLIILLVMWFTFLIIYIFIATAWPRPSWTTLLTVTGTSSLLILPLLYPQLKEALLNHNESFLISNYLTFSTDITAIFIPHWLQWTTRGVYLGIATSYLAVLAYIHQRRQAGLWLLLTITAFLFMIGPNPTFAGHDLGITLPWSAVIAPVLRSLYRVSILMAFGFSIVVAYGWLALATRLKTENTRTATAVIVILAIYIEFTISTTHATPVQVSTFYSQYLDSVPNHIALAILPTGRQVDKLQLYYQTIHEHKMTGGVVSRSSSTMFDFINNNPLLRAGAVDLEPVPLPEDVISALKDLADHHVGYLVLDKTLLDDIEAWRAKIPLEPIFEDELLLVYSTGLPIPQQTLPTPTLRAGE